jgi:hypothetical protein
MKVLLKWDNAEAFKQHLEEMRQFRQSHPSESALRARSYGHMPALYVLEPVKDTGGSNCSIERGAQRWLVPFWKVGKWRFSLN